MCVRSVRREYFAAWPVVTKQHLADVYLCPRWRKCSLLSEDDPDCLSMCRKETILIFMPLSPSSCHYWCGIWTWSEYFLVLSDTLGFDDL